MVQAEEVQQCCVKVVDVDRGLNRRPAELVGLSDNLSRFDSTASHPQAEGVSKMVSTRLLAVSFVRIGDGCAAELSRANNQSLVEQTSLFQIIHQSGGRLIDFHG